MTPLCSAITAALNASDQFVAAGQLGQFDACRPRPLPARGVAVGHLARL